MVTCRFLPPVFTAGFASVLAACSAADTAINHGHLDVQTHMSETVFLDPVPASQRMIYVSARNTSDHAELDLRAPLIQAMQARGYQVVQDPEAAHYMLRINVLQAGKIESKDKASLLAARYGEPLLGAGIGAAAGSAVSGGNPYAAGGAALAGGLLTFAANELVKDVTYSVVIDIQLSERPLHGDKVRQHTKTVANNVNVAAESTFGAIPEGARSGLTVTGHGRGVTQDVDEDSSFKKYEIREVAYADQMNLDFPTAVPALTTKLTSTLSNLFE